MQYYPFLLPIFVLKAEQYALLKADLSRSVDYRKLGTVA